MKTDEYHEAGAKAERIGAYAFVVVFGISMIGSFILAIIEKDIWIMLFGLAGIIYGAFAYVFVSLAAKSYYLVFGKKKK